MPRNTAIVPVPRTLSVGRYRLAVWQQPGAANVLYLHPGSNDAPAACERVFLRAAADPVPPAPFSIVCIDNVDWNRDLSPWLADKVFVSGEPFCGGADAYLFCLLHALLPAAEAGMDAPVKARSLAGYSMGGLFALYAMYRTDAFCRFASMSGSLWYDGFIDFMQTHAPACMPERVYLSLGNAERRTKNVRLSTVEACTRRAEALLCALGVPVCYEVQPGGHSSAVPKRLSDGMLSLLRP